MENTKMTKREMFEYIKEAMASDPNVVAFCDNELVALDKKNAQAKKAAAKKREESDALTDAIKAVLTVDPMTLDEILAAVAREDVTRNKLAPRLTKLVNAGAAIKGNANYTGEDGKVKKQVTYCLVG